MPINMPYLAEILCSKKNSTNAYEPTRKARDLLRLSLLLRSTSLYKFVNMFYPVVQEYRCTVNRVMKLK